METTRKCPYCGNEIQAAAKKCRHCKQWLPEMTADESQNQQPPKQENLATDSFNNSTLDFATAFNETIEAGLANIGWLILTVLVWLVTVWIPYLNIGTTIALANIPSEIAHGRSVTPDFLFRSIYRKYMGECVLGYAMESIALYLLMTPMIMLAALYAMSMGALGFASAYYGGGTNMIGVMIVILIPLSIASIIPMFALHYGWSFAPMLIIDRELNPVEAMSKSTKLTYGYKVYMFLTQLLIFIIAMLVWWLLLWIAKSANSVFLMVIFSLAILVTTASMMVANTSVFYKHLALKN